MWLAAVLFSFLASSSIMGIEDKELPLALYEIRRTIEKKEGIVFETNGEKNEVSPIISPIEKKKRSKKVELSPGEKKMQEALAKNKALIAKKYEKSPSKGKSSTSWMDSKKAQINSWESSRRESLNRWKKEKQDFLKKIPAYKKALTPLKEFSRGNQSSLFSSARVGFSNKEKLKKSSATSDRGAGISRVRGSFQLPVRKQGRRPTCAAFAAARAIELLSPVTVNLSEQYLYYASKKDCQGRPCSKPGSWPYYAFAESQRARGFSFPEEKNCPYNLIDKPQNQTQIPLRSTCNKKVVKVDSFREVRSTDDVFFALDLGFPVIAGFKLPESFFTTEGYIYHEPGMKMGSGIHAQGHALLLVGKMELPPSLHSSQGKHCVLAVNSWGEGWGKGGYACLSSKWFETYRYDMPFIVLEKVSHKNS